MAEMWAMLGTEFVSNLASALVYLAIAVIFVLCMIKCVAPVVNTKRLLARAIRLIKKGDKAGKSWQDEDFLGKGALYPHWSEYLNNLFFADGEFHNPSNVEDFINEDTTIYGPGRAAFAEAAPGLMTSLGFLGTLIGISMGLRGFSMDDAEQVMNAIRQLVPGMQYAFTTSIVGVVGSVLVTLITRMVNGSTQRALTDFYSAMNKHAGVLSVDPMTQIAIYQQEQTALIQGMSTEMRGAMADRLAGSLTSAMRASFSALEKSLNDYMAQATHEQIRGVDAVVQRFLGSMNASVDGQFDRLKLVLEDTCKNQSALNENVRQGMGELTRIAQNIIQVSQLSDQMLGKYETYMTKLGNTQKMTEDGYSRIAANVEHLEIVARQQNGYLQSVGKLQGDVIKALDQFEKASTRFMELFTENSAAAAGALSTAAGELKSSSDVLAANHKALVGGISKDIDHTFNEFFKSTNETVEHMSWMIEDVKNLIAQLPQSIEGAADLYAHQADRLSDALARSQAALDEAVDRLSQSAYTR